MAMVTPDIKVEVVAVVVNDSSGREGQWGGSQVKGSGTDQESGGNAGREKDYVVYRILDMYNTVQ